MRQPSDPTRRILLQGALALSATGVPSATNAATVRSVPLGDAAFNVRTVGKLLGDLSGVVTYT